MKSFQGDKQLAHQLNSLWAIDRQCKKSIIFVLSTNDHILYYAIDEHSPICLFVFSKIAFDFSYLYYTYIATMKDDGFFYLSQKLYEFHKNTTMD